MRVTNSGPYDEAAGEAVIELTTAVAGVAISGLPAGCTLLGTTVTCVNPLASGATQDYTFTVGVPLGAAETTIDMTAAVSGDNDDAVAANNDATATTDIVAPIDLTVGLVLGDTPLPADGETQATVTVTNNGPLATDTYEAAVVLPDGVTAVAGTLPAECTVSGQTVTCSGTPLAPTDSNDFVIDIAIAPTIAETAVEFSAEVSSTSAAHVDTEPANNMTTLSDVEVSELPPLVISGRVYFDENRDGVLDPGEADIPLVAIELLDATGTVVRSGADTSPYFLTGLAAGEYTIRLDASTLPAGFGSTTDLSIPVTLTDSNLDGQNFGFGLSNVIVNVTVNGASPGAGAVVVLTRCDGTEVSLSTEANGSAVLEGTLDSPVEYCTIAASYAGETGTVTVDALGDFTIDLAATVENLTNLIVEVAVPPGPITVGSTSTLTVEVTNSGPDDGSAPFTGTVVIPEGLEVIDSRLPSGATYDSASRTVALAGAVLAADDLQLFEIPVDVVGGVTDEVEVAVAVGGSDVDPEVVETNVDSVEVEVIPAALALTGIGVWNLALLAAILFIAGISALRARVRIEGVM